MCAANIYADRLEVVSIFMLNDDKDRDLRYKLYRRYADVAETFGSAPEKEELIKANKNVYRVLCYDTLLLAAISERRTSKEYVTVAKESSDLHNTFNDMNLTKSIMSKLKDMTGYAGEDYTKDSIGSLMNSFKDVNVTVGNKVEDEIIIIDDDPEEEWEYEEDIIVEDEPEEETEEFIFVDDDPEEEFPDSGEIAVEGEGEEVEIEDEEFEIVIDDSGDIIKGTEDIEYKADNLKSSLDDSIRQRKIDNIDTSVKDSESDVENDEEIDISDIGNDVPDIEEMLTAIMNRNEAIFENCFALDRPYGILYEKGVLTYKIVEGNLKYIPGVGRGVSVFEKLYQAIIRGTGAKLNTAHDLRNVPNVKNIVNTSYNYYPGYIFKFALGVVEDKTYKTWNKVKPAIELSIKNRLKRAYKEDIFFDNMEKIERIFSNVILVLSYEAGAGIKIRVSLPGVTIDAGQVEASIRSITTYRSAGITIAKVKGYNDVVDIQILLQEDKYLDRPYWAYKAMRVKMENKQDISLTAGIPFGRLVNGDTFEYKLDPSTRFLNFIAAGSGAGKGVLTLSLVAAAIGTGIPLFYLDNKPDMAKVFWDMEKEYGITTFTYDGMGTNRPNQDEDRYNVTYGMPKEVQEVFGDHARVILYLRGIQLMAAMAKHRASEGYSTNYMFVFDEIQAMQTAIKEAVKTAAQLKSDNTPKKVKGAAEEPNEIYKYMDKLLNWVSNVNTEITNYINNTGRASGIFTLFLAQSADFGEWRGLKAGIKKDGDTPLLSQILTARTILKILGKGTTTSKYGLGGDAQKALSEKELQYISNNRFFGMYDGTTATGAKVNVFKPFLTLNSDNPTEKCWVGGMGRMYGYGQVDNKQYIQNVAMDHPGEEGYTNIYGVHTGTGLKGLISMYCNGDMEKVKAGLQNSWNVTIDFFEETGLGKRYTTPSDYMYDMSLEGFMTVKEMTSFTGGVMETPSDGNGAEKAGEGTKEINMGFIGDTPNSTNKEGGNTDIFGEGKGDSEVATSFGGSERIKIEDDDEFKEELSSLEAYEKNRGRIESKIESEYGSHEEVAGDAIDELMENIMDSAPQDCDMLEYIAYSLDSDARNGYTDIHVAEALARRLELVEKGYINGYDYTNNELIESNIKKEEKPIYVDTSGENIVSSGGKGERVISIDTRKTRERMDLSRDNSIDCMGASLRGYSFFENILLDSMKGSEKYIDKLWTSVLREIKRSGYNPSLVTRVSIYGGQMYINGRIVILNGIIGGIQNVRLKDIVKFKILFKHFPMISELRIDEEMVRVALTEFEEEPIYSMFSTCRKLSTIYVRLRDNNVDKYDRDNFNKERARKLEGENKYLNEMEILCKSKSDRKSSWNKENAGDSIWGMRLAKSSMSRAGESFMNKNKPSVGKGVLYATAGFLGGTIGFLAWGGYKIGSGAVNGVRRLTKR